MTRAVTRRARAVAAVVGGALVAVGIALSIDTAGDPGDMGGAIGAELALFAALLLGAWWMRRDG